MHSCELITNLCIKKVLCHHVEVVRISGAALCFLQRDWLSPNSSWKSNQLNEAWGIGWGHQTLFSLWEGGVWARDYLQAGWWWKRIRLGNTTHHTMYLGSPDCAAILANTDVGLRHPTADTGLGTTIWRLQEQEKVVSLTMPKYTTVEIKAICI